MANRLAWGILGAGAIAKAFTHGVRQSGTGEVVAVGSRSREKATAFAREHGIDRAHGTYEALLADEAVEAVYVATPHPMHAEWTIRAIEAGKHVLCEKPLAMNHAEAMAMVEAARRAPGGGVFLAEAFMYRCHPQTAKLVDLIRNGAIGEIRSIEASFGFRAGYDARGRLFAPELGGGGILDIGCYTVSLARLIAGAALGRPFADPERVKGVAHLGETGVDETAAATLRFEQGILAQVRAAIRLNLPNDARIFGTEGWIHVHVPWTADREQGGTYRLTIHRPGKDPEQVAIDTDMTAFAYEARRVAEAIAAGRRELESPAMSWADSLGNMRTLDRWRHEVGLSYPCETPEGFARPRHGRPLARCTDHPMAYGRIKGLDKDVSRFVMGCDNQPSFAHAAVMFDDWFSRGGTTFDTSHIYGGGLHETLLGQWLRTRGVRDRCVILGKGLHTPFCEPRFLRPQVEKSLDRLQTDHVDVYILHRDNPDVPVGEFIDALDELRGEGRFALYGGSNWTVERFEAANRYAAEHGRQSMTVLSNNFSLARMIRPVWPGCVAASDPRTRAWLERTQTANFAWSSQARGYFLEGAERMKLGPDNFACWDSEDNRRRRERAERLAKRYGVRPINIAAAYVLCQRFPSFALIGPRTLEETTTSLPALGIQLSEAECRWLNLETDEEPA